MYRQVGSDHAGACYPDLAAGGDGQDGQGEAPGQVGRGLGDLGEAGGVLPQPFRQGPQREGGHLGGGRQRHRVSPAAQVGGGQRGGLGGDGTAQGGGVAAGRPGGLSEPGADLDDLPGIGQVPDHQGVVGGVRGHRDGGDQRVQVRGAARLGQLAAQGGADRQRIVRVPAVGQPGDGVPDDLMGGPVELAAVKDLPDLTERGRGQHHRAEDGLLRADVVRRRLPRHPVAVDHPQPASITHR